MSAETVCASPGAPASRIRAPSALAMSVNATTPSRLVSRSSTLPSIHARSTGPKRA